MSNSEARKRMATGSSPGEVRWTYQHAGTVIAPSLAEEEARALCPFGYQVVDVDMEPWECETVTPGFGEHSRTSRTWSTLLHVTAIAKEGE